MTYEEIKKELEDLPMTWYPALIKVMVTAAVERGVFLPGGAARFVKQVEDELPVPAVNQERVS